MMDRIAGAGIVVIVWCIAGFMLLGVIYATARLSQWLVRTVA